MVPTLARLALPRLRLRPDHRVLEVGCGGGTAVAAVAGLLTTGHILAIDRSASQVARAVHRNAVHISSGVARILQLDLSELTVDDPFDTIFALNVNLFYPFDATTAEVVRGALRRRGRLVLGYRRLGGPSLAERADRISANLLAGGLRAPTVEWATPEQFYVTATRA